MGARERMAPRLTLLFTVGLDRPVPWLWLHMQAWSSGLCGRRVSPPLRYLFRNAGQCPISPNAQTDPGLGQPQYCNPEEALDDTSQPTGSAVPCHAIQPSHTTQISPSLPA